MAEQYEPPKRPNSVLERLAGRQAKEPPGDESVRDSFSMGRVSDDDDLMLDVRLKDGSRYAFPYGTLLKVDFSPRDELKLVFSANIVVIEGRRLLPLYDLLRRHKAKFVQEGTDAEDGLKPDDAAHIDSIHIQKPEEENV
ncbi:MAG: hypothetical protein K2X03_11020 [Bryobacteraceae bacterium]|nr:hypothetical protein [Bryobacteraceae bacterium]